jgi:hypothetical protein
MWCEHVIEFFVAKVEFIELQRYNLVLVFSNYVDPLRKVHNDQGVLEISRHIISIYCISQRWYVGG